MVKQLSFDQVFIPSQRLGFNEVLHLLCFYSKFDLLKGNWKIAMLRHWNTNEVFILMAGQADLIVFDGNPNDHFYVFPYVFPMELNVAHDIQQLVWHHVAISPDTPVIIVERSETSVETADCAELSVDLVSTVKARFTVKG
jgi:hypothetical protein